MITIDSSYAAAKNAINAMVNALLYNKNPDSLTPYVITFEDTMNGLSGQLLNLDESLQREIHNGCGTVVTMGAVAGVTISLHESLLPKEERVQVSVVNQVGKKLYPLTTTVTVNKSSTVTTSNTTSTNATSSSGVSTSTSTTTEEEDVVDPIFDENDNLDIVEPTLAEIQNDTVPYLKSGMIALALEAAANANGLQAGLRTFSHNPLATIIDTTKDLLLYYTEGNYANLNVALDGVSSDVALAAEYKLLREAVGGSDGLSGCVTQMDFFKEHTDRLSGLILDIDSPNDVVDNDSTDEYININDFSGGPAKIFSFDARYFRSAKYMIQATAAAADRGHQATELYILHDNHHAYTREVTSIYTQDPFITFTTHLINNNVEILATTTEANTDFVIYGVRLRIARAAHSYGEMSQTKIIDQHETLASYLNDGVDYVALQSASLLHPALVGNLGREFNDMLVYLASTSFLDKTTGEKQADLIRLADLLEERCAEIQSAVETDYNNFLECRRKIEALDIAFKLSVSYTDDTGNSIPASTLNTATIQAIEADE